MHEPSHALPERHGHAADLAQVAHVLRPSLREDGGEDVVLVVEVVVHQAVRDARLLGDVCDARTVEAGAREHLGRRREDALARVRAALAARLVAARTFRLRADALLAVLGARGAHDVAPAVRSASISLSS